MFAEYTNWIGRDLGFQNYEEELHSLPGKYAEPEGLLLMAVSADGKACCVALRRFDQNKCEMKRLYVRSEYRGQNIGASLVESIILAAKEKGYQEILLDTLAFMSGAIGLYRKLGFEETDAYYNNPMLDVIYFKRRL